MTTLSNLQPGALNRLEDQGVFWDITAEIYPLIVEAMMAATLITGEPQFRDVTALYTIAANPNPTGFLPITLPSDALALLRIDGAGGIPIDRCFISDLDKSYPGWELTTGPQIRFWIPFGLGQYGVYPNLTAPQQVWLTYVQVPVVTPRPYTGSEVIPFQAEYLEAFEDYASAMASLKEGYPEFDQAQARLQRFLAKMEALSNFAYRKGSLRFTRSAGSQARINEVTVR